MEEVEEGGGDARGVVVGLGGLLGAAALARLAAGLLGGRRRGGSGEGLGRREGGHEHGEVGRRRRRLLLLVQHTRHLVMQMDAIVRFQLAGDFFNYYIL